MNVFDRYSKRYDEWFDKNRFAYLSEIKAIKKVAPRAGGGLEIGVGTGRFAKNLGIKTGIDPSLNMLALARKRGIKAFKGCGEKLSFKNETFKYALMVVTICFVKDAGKVINEAARVLKRKGKIIIDKNSGLGRYYKKRKDSPFYRNARFYSAPEIVSLIKDRGFKKIKVYQTLFEMPGALRKADAVKAGWGKGSFIVISGEKDG